MGDMPVGDVYRMVADLNYAIRRYKGYVPPRPDAVAFLTLLGRHCSHLRESPHIEDACAHLGYVPEGASWVMDVRYKPGQAHHPSAEDIDRLDERIAAETGRYLTSKECALDERGLRLTLRWEERYD